MSICTIYFLIFKRFYTLIRKSFACFMHSSYLTTAFVDFRNSYPFLPKSAGISPHFLVSHLKIGTVILWVRSQFSARAIIW